MLFLKYLEIYPSIYKFYSWYAWAPFHYILLFLEKPFSPRHVSSQLGFFLLSLFTYILLRFLSPNTNLGSFEKQEPQLWQYLQQIGGSPWLMVDVEGSSWLCVVLLSCVGKQVEQATQSVLPIGLQHLYKFLPFHKLISYIHVLFVTIITKILCLLLRSDIIWKSYYRGMQTGHVWHEELVGTYLMGFQWFDYFISHVSDSGELCFSSHADKKSCPDFKPYRSFPESL